MSALLQGNVHTKAVEVAVAGDQAVGFQGGAVVLHDVGSVGRAQVKVLPVEQHTRRNGLLVILAVAAPDDDVAQFAVDHTGVVGAVHIGDDDQLNVEQILHQGRAPAGLHAAVVGQLAVNLQLDGLAVQRVVVVQVALDLVVGHFREGRSAAERQHQRQHEGNEFLHGFGSPFKMIFRSTTIGNDG